MKRITPNTTKKIQVGSVMGSGINDICTAQWPEIGTLERQSNKKNGIPRAKYGIYRYFCRQYFYKISRPDRPAPRAMAHRADENYFSIL